MKEKSCTDTEKVSFVNQSFSCSIYRSNVEVGYQKVPLDSTYVRSNEDEP